MREQESRGWGLKLVMRAVCIMKNRSPSFRFGSRTPAAVCLVQPLSIPFTPSPQIRLKDPGSGRMVDDYWEASKKMLMEVDFLGSLRGGAPRGHGLEGERRGPI